MCFSAFNKGQGYGAVSEVGGAGQAPAGGAVILGVMEIRMWVKRGSYLCGSPS